MLNIYKYFGLLHLALAWNSVLSAVEVTSDDLCTDGTISFRLELKTDLLPGETTWDIEDIDNSTVIYEYGPYDKVDEYTIFNHYFCLDSSGCYKFIIKDLYGGFNEWYKLYYGGEFIKEGCCYGKRQSTVIGNCPTSRPSPKPSFTPSTLPSSSPAVTPEVMPLLESKENKNDNSSTLVWSLGGVGIFVGVISLVVFVKYFRRSGVEKENRPPPEIDIY